MKHAAPEGLVVVAQIAGAHGVRGEARIRSYTEIAEDCFSFGPLLDRDGRVLVTVARFQPHKDVFIVTTKETRQREEWEALKGTDLFAPREAFPDTDEDEFYVADLVGLSVTHADGRSLGVVRHVHNFGAGDLLEVTAPAGESFMLPFTREAVPAVDIAAARITAAPQEALLPPSLQDPALMPPEDDAAAPDEG